MYMHNPPGVLLEGEGGNSNLLEQVRSVMQASQPGQLSVCSVKHVNRSGENSQLILHAFSHISQKNSIQPMSDPERLQCLLQSLVVLSIGKSNNVISGQPGIADEYSKIISCQSPERFGQGSHRVLNLADGFKLTHRTANYHDRITPDSNTGTAKLSKQMLYMCKFLNLAFSVRLNWPVVQKALVKYVQRYTPDPGSPRGALSQAHPFRLNDAGQLQICHPQCWDVDCSLPGRNFVQGKRVPVPCPLLFHLTPFGYTAGVECLVGNCLLWLLGRGGVQTLAALVLPWSWFLLGSLLGAWNLFSAG